MITIHMKRISLILLAALGLLSLSSSCKKQQDVPRLSQVDFSVLEAKTYLPVESSTATVRLDKAPAKAYSSASWLQVAQEGATIRLTSTDNINPQSRNASLVLKDSKGDSIAINIMQAGIIFGLPKEQAMIGGMLPSTRRSRHPQISPSPTPPQPTGSSWSPRISSFASSSPRTPRAAPARAGSSPRGLVSLTHFRSHRSISPTS